METRVLDEVLLRGWSWDTRDDGSAKLKKARRVWYWGDDVDVLEPDAADDPQTKYFRVQFWNPHANGGAGGHTQAMVAKRRSGSHWRPLRWRTADQQRLLEVTFIDVQQGDATLVRTPGRKVMLVDGGEGPFVARMLATWFPGTSEEAPLDLDYLVISHGDADHFAGLREVADARKYSDARRELHARVLRCVHNGLVKGPSKAKQADRFGTSVERDGERYVTSLYDDTRDSPDPNRPFKTWNRRLDSLLPDAADAPASPVAGESLPWIRRVGLGDTDAFAALADEGLGVEVMGPAVEEVDGAPALRYLRAEDGGRSTGHTINGHSVILRLIHGRVRLLLGGDLNTHGAEHLLHHLDARDPVPELQSEVLKVPHHGSHEFSDAFLARVAPVISVVSSGDENAAKEYVHPRANLMGALGRHARPGAPALVFVTELAAFFEHLGPLLPEQHETDAETGELVDREYAKSWFTAFERKRFGRVHLRTDGERIFVATESYSDGIKEGYLMHVQEDGSIVEEPFQII